MAQFASDLFTDTNGVSLPTHDANWTKHGSYTGNMEIFSNRTIHSDTNTALFYRSESPTNANYTVSSDLYCATYTGYDGVAGRVNTGADTFYMGRHYVSAGAWQLYKFVGGSPTQLGSNYSISYSPGNQPNCLLRMDGDQISVDIDSVTRIGPVTDTSITAAGKAGIRGNGSTTTTGFHYDNFSADDIVSSTVTLHQTTNYQGMYRMNGAMR